MGRASQAQGQGTPLARLLVQGRRRLQAGERGVELVFAHVQDRGAVVEAARDAARMPEAVAAKGAAFSCRDARRAAATTAIAAAQL